MRYYLLMQFIVTAHDYKNGLKNRLSARKQHVAMGNKMLAAGNYHMGVALIDDQGDMCGSVMIFEYPTREDLDKWLEIEPYVVNKVWESWDVQECKIGPTFIK